MVQVLSDIETKTIEISFSIKEYQKFKKISDLKNLDLTTLIRSELENTIEYYEQELSSLGFSL